MPGIKTSDLTKHLGSPADSDVIAFVDVSQSRSKKITIADMLLAAPRQDWLDSDAIVSLIDSDHINARVDEIPLNIDTINTQSGLFVNIDPSDGGLISHDIIGSTSYAYDSTWEEGANVLLHLHGGANQVLWPATYWIGGSAPNLSDTSGKHIIKLWKLNSDVYGDYQGLATLVESSLDGE